MPSKHFIKNAAKRPNIDRSVENRAIDVGFRGSEALFRIIRNNSTSACETRISNFELGVLLKEQDIVHFKVHVGYGARMEIIEADEHLSDHMAHLKCGKGLFLLPNILQIARGQRHPNAHEGGVSGQRDTKKDVNQSPLGLLGHKERITSNALCEFDSNLLAVLVPLEFAHASISPSFKLLDELETFNAIFWRELHMHKIL